MKTSLALFDFDGTITWRDSYLRFLIYFASWAQLLLAAIVLFPTAFAYLCSLIDNSKAKAITLRWFFRGVPRELLLLKGEAFCMMVVPFLVRPKALERIRWHRLQGHRVLLVTASVREWVEPWAKSEGMEVVATELHSVDGVLSGDMATPNNWGPEKVRRIEELLQLEDYDKVYAYGDSRGDQEMLAVADEKFFRPFRV